MKRLTVMSLALAALAWAGTASAALNVLWYSGGVEANSVGQYKTAMGTTLVADAAAGGVNPVSVAGQTWNVTFWDAGAMPAGSFDVLVVASPQGFWSSVPSYGALNAAAPALGDRVMVTGQDADWHFINFPGAGNFDGPQGFLIDAINWAGNGTGLGAVILGADDSTGVLTALGLQASLGPSSGATNNVVIPGAYAAFPINQGLTSAGLSNWSTSAHGIWAGADPNVWTAINTNGVGGAPVTLVSKATAGGGTGVPEPASFAIWAGLGAIGLAIGWKKRSA